MRLDAARDTLRAHQARTPALAALRSPDIDLEAYLDPPSFASRVGAPGTARYLPVVGAAHGPLNEGGYTHPRGYLGLSTARYWPLLANQRHRGFEQPTCGVQDDLRLSRRPVQCVRARGSRVVAEAHAQHDGATHSTRGAQPTAHAVDEPEQRRVHGIGAQARQASGVLRAD